MFDPSIFMNLQQAFQPPEPPQMVFERQWLSDFATVAERRASAISKHYEEQAQLWDAELTRVSKTLQTFNPEAFTADAWASFDAMLSDAEAIATYRAQNGARAEKKAARWAKSLGRDDPSLGQVWRSYSRKMSAIDERVIRRLLDFAMFLRAFRATLHPAARGGPVFEDAADLERYLNDAVAA